MVRVQALFLPTRSILVLKLGLTAAIVRVGSEKEPVNGVVAGQSLQNASIERVN
jgi:hypothetical protein